MPRRRSSSVAVAASQPRKVLHRAQQTGRRLAGDLKAAFNTLPPECRTIRSMAAYLNIDPSICRRAISASQFSDEPLDALHKAPGIAGLRLLRDALEQRAGTSAALASLGASIEHFALLIQDAGGSHAKLRRHLTTTRNPAESKPTSDGDSPEQLRRQVMQDTAAWLGTLVETHANILIGRIAPDAPEFLEGGKIRAYLGHRSRVSGLPLVMTNWYFSGSPKDRSQTLDPAATKDMIARAEGVSLLPEFSSDPLPVISARADSRNSVHIIDPQASNSAPVNSVIFNRLPRIREPRLCAMPLLTMYLPVEQPCRHIIHDVWLDKKLMDGAHLTAAFGRMTPPLHRGEGLPWYDRLPTPAILETYTADTFKPSAGWTRHDEATRRLFDLLEYDWQDFVCYRLEQTYPLWASAAIIMLDYAAHEQPAADTSAHQEV